MSGFFSSKVVKEGFIFAIGVALVGGITRTIISIIKGLLGMYAPLPLYIYTTHHLLYFTSEMFVFAVVLGIYWARYSPETWEALNLLIRGAYLGFTIALIFGLFNDSAIRELIASLSGIILYAWFGIYMSLLVIVTDILLLGTRKLKESSIISDVPLKEKEGYPTETSRPSISEERYELIRELSGLGIVDAETSLRLLNLEEDMWMNAQRILRSMIEVERRSMSRDIKDKILQALSAELSDLLN